MARGDERFRARAAEAGIPVSVSHFPEGTRTATDAARAVGCDVAQIVKSLVFVADGEPVLVLAPGPTMVDTDRVAAFLGVAEVRRATADEVREATGYAIGGVPPFGHAMPLRVAIDEVLLAHDEVWAAAGAPDACFPIAPAELVCASGGIVGPLAAR